MIELGPFDLSQETELNFEFKDIENGSWKSGMQWDFIELRLVAPGILKIDKFQQCFIF